MVINWTAIESGVGVAVAAGAAAVPIIKNLIGKIKAILAQLGINTHMKSAVQDAQAAIAAKTNAAKLADVDSAVVQAIMAVKGVLPELSALEALAVKELASVLVKPQNVPLVNDTAVAHTMDSIHNAFAAASTNAVVQEVKKVTATPTA